MATISLKWLLLDWKERQGKICCMCKKPYAKYIVTTDDETKLFCNICVLKYMGESKNN